MTSCCAGPAEAPQLRLQRRVFWTVLWINAVMFVVEAGAGWSAESVSLQADALDFLGDSVNYATALFVLGRSLTWRAGMALAKGITMFGFGAFVLAGSVVHAVVGASPSAPVMGVVGAIALLANVACAVLLYRFRSGDANLRAVWLCSRNDVIGNVAVLVAASGVLLSGTLWPDLLVGLIMAGLAMWAGGSVILQARGELRQARVVPAE